MKKFLTTILLLVFAVLQTGAAEKWLTDFEKAKAKAKEENKSILVNFTGSDW